MGCALTRTCIKCGCPSWHYSNGNVSNMNCQVHRPGVIRGIEQCSDCGKGYARDKNGGNCRHVWKKRFM